jgi:amino acid transporter
VVAREKERYGGIKIGSAFFGWLAATGMAVVLLALLSAVGAAVGAASGTTPDEAAGRAAQDPAGAGLLGAVALLVVLFVAYACGGYVAGRMARFDGLKQGLAVWLWAVVIALVVAVLVAVAGARFDVLSQLSLPRIPVTGDDLTTGGVVTLLLVAAVTLAGAIVGGLAGMRFHRRVDRAGLGR